MDPRDRRPPASPPRRSRCWPPSLAQLQLRAARAAPVGATRPWGVVLTPRDARDAPGPGIDIVPHLLCGLPTPSTADWLGIRKFQAFSACGRVAEKAGTHMPPSSGEAGTRTPTGAPIARVAGRQGDTRREELPPRGGYTAWCWEEGSGCILFRSGSIVSQPCWLLEVDLLDLQRLRTTLQNRGRLLGNWSRSNPDGPQVVEADQEAFRATLPVYRQ